MLTTTTMLYIFMMIFFFGFKCIKKFKWMTKINKASFFFLFHSPNGCVLVMTIDDTKYIFVDIYFKIYFLE